MNYRIINVAMLCWRGSHTATCAHSAVVLLWWCKRTIWGQAYHRLGHPSRVFVSLSSPAGAASGLVADSVIMTDNIATVLEKAIDPVIGKIPDMLDVDAALRHTLGL